MTISVDQAQNLTSGSTKVHSSTGEKLGTMGQIYLDDSTGQPTWVTVKTGLFGTSESLVPLNGSRLDGEAMMVGYDKATVKDAPRIDLDGRLSPEEEDKLFHYYGLTDAQNTQQAEQGKRSKQGPGDIVGRDISGPTTGDAMTRSEEQVQVGVQSRESGRARLRKYVVTENVTQSVPVRHEEVRVVREPITEDNRDQAMTGSEITEAEHEVILHQERPIVQKETVPMERIRMTTDTVTEDATVSEDVRKEYVDTTQTNTNDQTAQGNQRTAKARSARDQSGR